MIDRFIVLLASIAVSGIAEAGPPYQSDDPKPTDFKHFEIYLFANGTSTRDGSGGAYGIDFNYGATPDLQLTAVFPVEYEHPTGANTLTGLGNIELAAKYRFLHQADVGWDVAVFPRIFLASASTQVGERDSSLLLPVWAEKDWDKWSTFGGGGCVIGRSGASQDFCLAGWALTREMTPNLTLGAEIVHQTPDTRGGHPSTGLGAGLLYDLNENFHLLAYAGPGLQNVAETGRYSWYASILWTF